LDNDYNYISSCTLFLVILIYVYILMFFVDSWYACFEAYGTVLLDHDDYAMKNFYLFVKWVL